MAGGNGGLYRLMKGTDEMTQQEILQELKNHGGSLAVAAANEIERLMAQNTDLDNSLNTLTTAYNNLLDHMPAWISVRDKLPQAEDAYGWVSCTVTVIESVSNPFTDEPYDRKFVSPAVFDTEQKIWHIGRDEASEVLTNALLGIPLTGYYVTHWMPRPIAAGED